MRRVSGVLTETKPLAKEPEAGGREVIRFRKGDIVLIHGHYAQIDGFFKNRRGNICLRLGLPKDPAAFSRWAARNPDKVKRLESGHIVT